MVLTPERKLSRERHHRGAWKISTSRAITCKCRRPRTSTSSTCPKSCCVATTRC